MLTNTRATFDKIFMDFKRFSYYFSILFNCVYILVMVYALVAGTGNLFINLLLLVGAIAYFVFFVLTYWTDEKSKERKTARRVYRAFKFLMTCISLSITVYGLYVATEDVTVISVLLAALSFINWIFGITTTVIIEFVESRRDMLLAALAMDFEKLTKPVNTIGNAVRKIAGKEPKEQQTVSEVMEQKINKIRESYLQKKQKNSSSVTKNT